MSWHNFNQKIVFRCAAKTEHLTSGCNRATGDFGLLEQAISGLETRIGIVATFAFACFE
jgi:hypothetical protein